MFNSDTELFFPIRVIPFLSDLRGPEWNQLIQHLSSKSTEDSELIAFTGLMVKLAGCGGCDADSFRSMRGCTQCARLVVKRYKGSDSELISLYNQSKAEVNEFLSKRNNNIG